MTKTSSKRSLKPSKPKSRHSQLQVEQYEPKSQVCRIRKSRGPYLRSKSKLQIKTKATPQLVQVKLEQISQENIYDQNKYQGSLKLKKSKRMSSGYIKKMENKSLPKIFYSDKFEEIEQEDLLIYLKTLNQRKMSGVIMVNEFGKIIYSDKMGHELFQGSLNKFGTLKVQNLLLKTVRDQNLEQLKQIKSYNENTIFKWIIYSKNNKRRYSSVPFDSNNSNLSDIYFRFLKCLTIRIRPIKVKIEKFDLFQGLWNHHNIDKQSYKECFMLEVKHSTQMPSLDKDDILNDQILQKYIKSNLKKTLRLSSQAASSPFIKEEVNNVATSDSIPSQASLPKAKKLSEHQQNMQNEYDGGQNKGMKSEEPKSQSLKDDYGVCLITEIFFDEE